MEHNLNLGPDAQANHTLAALRGTEQSGQINVDPIAVSGVFFGLDPNGKVGGTFTTTPGDLLSLKFEVEQPGRWMGLHVALGDVPLDGAQVLGFVLKSDAPVTVTFRACLRSGTADGFVDCFFPKRIITFSDPTIHLDVLKMGVNAPVPTHAPWRDLILFFEPQSQEVAIRDLRVFVV